MEVGPEQVWGFGWVIHSLDFLTTGQQQQAKHFETSVRWLSPDGMAANSPYSFRVGLSCF